jgi:hypothetical protein
MPKVLQFKLTTVLDNIVKQSNKILKSCAIFSLQKSKVINQNRRNLREKKIIMIRILVHLKKVMMMIPKRKKRRTMLTLTKKTLMMII